jgi:streptogramin lyase
MIGLFATAMYAQQAPVVLPYVNTKANATIIVGNGTTTDAAGAATSVGLNGAQGIAVDALGNIYIGQRNPANLALVKKVDPVTGQLTYFAGGAATASTTSGLCASGQISKYGDGCPAQSSSYLAGVRSLTVGVDGAVYILDYTSSDLRKVDPGTGIISNVVGRETGGNVNGVGGPYSTDTATMHNPEGVVIGPDGSMYIGDSKAYGVRKVDPSGNVTTLTISTDAAGCTVGSTGATTSTTLASDVSMDGAGNLYVANTNCSNILVFIANSNSIAGITSGSAVSAITLTVKPTGLVVDPAGNIFYTEGQNIWFYDQSTKSSRVIVSGFTTVYHFARDQHGNLYVMDYGANYVYFVPAAQTAATLATGQTFPATPINPVTAPTQQMLIHFGNGVTPAAVNPYVASTSDFSVTPGSCTANADGTNDCTITISFTPKQVGYISASITVNGTSGPSLSFGVSGTGTGALVAADPGSATILSGAPSGKANGVAVDRAGNVYIADTNNNVILKYPAGGGSYSIFAGTSGQAGYSGDAGAAISAKLNGPQGVAVDPAGNVFIADTANNVVRRVDAVTLSISTVMNGLSSPVGIVADFRGNVYVSDTGHNLVKRLDTRLNLLGTVFLGGNTVAGGGSASGTLCTPGVANYKGTSGTKLDSYFDGCDPLQAILSGPEGLAVDGSGNLYIADTGNSLIRVVNADTQTITALSATTTKPAGVAVDTAGDIYFVDSTHDQVMMVAAGTPSVATAIVGQTGSLLGGLSAPFGMAAAGNGTIYVADGGYNQVVVVNRLSPAMTFPSVTANTTSTALAEVTNIGNGSANLVTLGSPWFLQTGDTVDFTLGAPWTCTANEVLAPGVSCDFSVAFLPPSTTSYSGSVQIETSANSPTMTLSGSGGKPGTITTVGDTGSPLSSATITLTASVAPQSSSNTQVPTGTVTFYVDGVAQTPVSLDNNGNTSLPLSPLSVGTHS